MNGTEGLTQYPLARRGMMMSGLITGLTLATARVEAQALHTDAQGLVVGAFKLPTSDGELPAYFARPEGAGPFPTVIVIEEIFGVHEYIKDVCRRHAKLGRLAVAPELYARIGDLSTMTDAGAIVRDVISKAPDDRMLADLDSAATWAAANHGDPAHLGVMGFCRGGRDTWLFAAHNPHLKAAVAFYGPLGGGRTAIQPHTPSDVIGELKCPLLGLYGGADPSSPPALIDEAEAKAHADGKTVEIHVYAGAPHGFHADYRPSYRPEAAADGWRRMNAWFKKYGVD